MSNQPFSFPPPPPPPPKRSTEGTYQQSHGAQQGSHSGRGNFRGGRGGYGGNRPAPPTNHAQSFSNRRFDAAGPPRGSYLNTSQKRNHAIAFSPANHPRPRPTAAPAVPSFNATIEHLLPRKQLLDQPSTKAHKPRKQNILGLTPAKLEHDSGSEDDEDEENRLAVVQPSSNIHSLVFEYRGTTSALRTSADIAAWIAERRKRYPTQARIEAAKKEAEDKRRKWEEEKKARFAARREAQVQREKERAEQKSKKQKTGLHQKKEESTSAETAGLDHTARAKLKAERLRKKALKAQEQLAKAEEALRLAETKQLAFDSVLSANPPNLNEAPERATHDTASDPDLTDSDATSSSGPSTSASAPDSDSDDESNPEATSDSDSAPETVSTKRAALAQGTPLSAGPPARTTRPARLCNKFAQDGRCKFGSQCRYSHDMSTMQKKDSRGKAGTQKQGATATTTTSAAGNIKRKGLWQVMVEKEREEERRRLLGAIIALGQNGVLDDAAKKEDQNPSV